MESDVEDLDLRGQLDALTASVNPVPRLDAVLRRGARLRRRRRAGVALCSLLVVSVVGTVASSARSGGGEGSRIDVVAPPSPRIDTVASPSTWFDPSHSRDCSNADFSVLVPSRWYANQPGAGVAACVAFTTVVEDQRTLIYDVYFPWGELQPPFDAPPIVINRESNVNDTVVIADIIERDTGTRPEFADPELRSFSVPVGVGLFKDQIGGADRAWRLYVRTNKAADGTPDGVTREYVVASNRNRLIWARFDPSKHFVDKDPLAFAAFDVLVRSLRLAA